MPRHGQPKRKQCKVNVRLANGKTIKCGMFLDEFGNCPEHGRPW